MANTRIEYLYRDASNYKTHNEVIVEGTLTKSQIQNIIKTLDEGEFFLPAQVGFPEERSSDWDEQVDHPWFELHASDFSETNDSPTSNVKAAELEARFQALAGHWTDKIGDDGKQIIP